ncbi:jg4993 [Pararge aegeria aegeria]|uniref:Jg4993 protein n=1 Tax=Pararge aegeria aegeria TaxID=348720 RepID=A0A8S4QVB8_9NEOP|nr:jg4993 [Pararge aegeria aegeria]
MPKRRKQSFEKRHQLQKTLHQSLRAYNEYHLAENLKARQQIKKDKTINYNSIHRRNEDYVTNEREQNRIRMAKLRSDDTNKKISQSSGKRKSSKDDSNISHKKARLDSTVSGPKLRQIEKEKKQKERMNEFLKYNENFSSKLAYQVKNGKEKKSAKLYQTVLAKQCQNPEICTCCLRKLYNSINKITDYKKLIVLQRNMVDCAYNFKQSEFLCDSCWNSLRIGNKPKKAATKNLSFTKIPDCLKRLGPLGVRLVSPWLPFLQIIPLQQYTVYPQLSLKGNIVNVEVDVGEMMKCLPRRPEEARVVQIEIKRKKEYKTSYMAENIVVKDVQSSMSNIVYALEH